MARQTGQDSAGQDCSQAAIITYKQPATSNQRDIHHHKCARHFRRPENNMLVMSPQLPVSGQPQRLTNLAGCWLLESTHSDTTPADCQNQPASQPAYFAIHLKLEPASTVTELGRRSVPSVPSGPSLSHAASCCRLTDRGRNSPRQPLRKRTHSFI